MAEDGRDDAYLFLDERCPVCGSWMRAVSLPSGSLVMQCRSCGQIRI